MRRSLGDHNQRHDVSKFNMDDVGFCGLKPLMQKLVQVSPEVATVDCSLHDSIL
jgi:hypothetical protein